MKSILFIGGLVCSMLCCGQVSNDSELFELLKAKDSLLFERGFNNCDLDQLKDLIADDLKFYHDQSGIQDKDGFFKAIEQNICSNWDQKPIRRLKNESLVVFPMYNNGILYGAIQKGEHDFFIREKGKADRFTSTARFTHLWVLENSNWKIGTVLSYDHKSPQ